jgi:hypothetical protein
MIKYALNCENRHEFESWFQNGAAFDLQAERGLVHCPHCQTSKVTKAIMAPAVTSRTRLERENPTAEPAMALTKAVPLSDPAGEPAGGESQPIALIDEGQRELRAMLRNLRQRIISESVDVGDRFTEEARKIHDGDMPQRPIHGQATLEEAKALLQEGIGILPLPQFPEDCN